MENNKNTLLHEVIFPVVIKKEKDDSMDYGASYTLENIPYPSYGECTSSESMPHVCESSVTETMPIGAVGINSLMKTEVDMIDSERKPAIDM